MYKIRFSRSAVYWRMNRKAWKSAVVFLPFDWDWCFLGRWGKKIFKYTGESNLMGSLVWASACVSSPASEAVSAAVAASCEMARDPYGPFLVRRNAGSPAEQGSQPHHERKGTKSLDSISSSQRVGEGERGRGGELQLHWFKSSLIMSHGLAVYMKDNGWVQLIMIGLPLQW